MVYRVQYSEKMPNGMECGFTFSIDDCGGGSFWHGNILHRFAELSKTAYIDIGNKMKYGTADQGEIAKRVAASSSHPDGGEKDASEDPQEMFQRWLQKREENPPRPLQL